MISLACFHPAGFVEVWWTAEGGNITFVLASSEVGTGWMGVGLMASAATHAGDFLVCYVRADGSFAALDMTAATFRPSADAQSNIVAAAAAREGNVTVCTLTRALVTGDAADYAITAGVPTSVIYALGTLDGTERMNKHNSEQIGRQAHTLVPAPASLLPTRPADIQGKKPNMIQSLLACI